MFRSISRYLLLVLFLPLVLALPSLASYEVGNFTQSELDRLVAPIALYPDPLLAQMLPASTFVEQIQEADTYIHGVSGYDTIDEPSWDTSVRALSHYPSVLDMMSSNLDWTTALGQAYLDQPDDVMDAVQRLRHKALDYGYLRSTAHEDVIVESGGYIRIDPAEADYIYVPRYDPDIVFVRSARSDESMQNILSFGLGLAIGSWLNRDTDWDHHRVFYHGWNGGGWIARSRSHVTMNDVYVNKNYANQSVPLNHAVAARDITPYRNELRKNNGKSSPPRTISVPAYTGNRTSEPTNRPAAVVTPRANRPGATNQRNIAPNPAPFGAGGKNPTRSQPKPAVRSTGSGQQGAAQQNRSTTKSGRDAKSTSGHSKASDKGKTTTDKRAKDAGNPDKGK